MPKQEGPTPEEKALLEKLRALRKRQDLKPLPLSRYLRTEIVGLDGEVQPLVVRYYQTQGVLNLLAVKRMVLGDATGIGKTLQSIITFCHLWEKNPNHKVVVVAPKSALRQWAGELDKFTQGVKTFIVSTPKGKKDSGVEGRKKIYEAWQAHQGPAVLIINYALLIRDWNHDNYQPLLPNGRPDPKKPVIPGLLDRIFKQVGKDMTAVFDEAQAFKSDKTKTWEVVKYMAEYSGRAYGLTATLIKNHLMEAYCIYKALVPRLFSTKTKFYEDFCFIELQRVARGHKIPIVVGYKNLDKFKEQIELYYLGRLKHEVSDELPTLTTKEVSFELGDAEVAKYEESLLGILELGDGEVREFEETKALTALIYCQQVVNSLALLKFEAGSEVWNMVDNYKVGDLSSKEQALVDLLTEELEGEKVIVYTRFESHVARLQKILEKHKIKSVRITGAEDDTKRRDAQQKFQDLKSDTQVVFITAAGSEAINLQAASGLIFFDMPWSWGDYVQILGRMIRIGSIHKGVLCFHLMAELKGVGKARKTIDQHVYAALRKKKNLVDKVLGEAAVGALKFDKSEAGTSLKELVRSMQGRE